MNDLFLHEVSEGTVEAGGTGEPIETVAETVETAPVETPAAPQLDPLEIQAELEQLRQQNQQWAAIFQAAEQHQTGGGNAGEVDWSQLDPFADGFSEQLAGALQADRQQTLNEMRGMLAELAAPLAARQAQETAAEGNQRLQDMLADDIARNGEFSPDAEADKQARQLVRTVADQMFPEIAQRFGATPRAAEIAMARAADQVRGLLRAAGQTATTEQANRLATLAAANGELGPGSAAVQTMSASPLSVREIARKYGQRASALNGS